MRRLLGRGLPALALIAGPVPAVAAPGIGAFAANAGARADSAIVTTLNESDLRALVLAAGDSVDAVQPFDEPSVRGKDKSGLKYLLIGSDCPKASPDRCSSVMMQVRYTADDLVTLKGINDANYSEAGVSTWWDEGGKIVGFTRFVDLRGGVTWANLKANLRLLIEAQYAAQVSIWPED